MRPCSSLPRKSGAVLNALHVYGRGSRLFPLPLVPRMLSIFPLLLFYWDTQREPLRKERELLPFSSTVCVFMTYYKPGTKSSSYFYNYHGLFRFLISETLGRMGTSFGRSVFWGRLSEQVLVMIGRWYSQQLLTIKRDACPPKRSQKSLYQKPYSFCSLDGGLWLEWIPQNQVEHLMFITQRYTLFTL